MLPLVETLKQANVFFKQEMKKIRVFLIYQRSECTVVRQQPQQLM